MITEEEIITRNNLIGKFFDELGWDVKIYGNVNKPAVVLCDKIVLNCYAKNFKLIFTDAISGGSEIVSYRLSTKPYNFTEQQLMILQEWLNNYEHRRAHAIQVKGTNLRLCGYNYVDSQDPSTKHPVFARKNYKLYFDAEFAGGIIDSYSDEELELELV